MIEKRNIFYKYHRLNQYLFDLLRNKTLWFSSQNDLNDPFDCKYSLTEEYLEKLRRKACNELFNDLKEGVSAMANAAEENFYQCMLPMLQSQEWLNGLHNLLFGDLGWCVCCFTTDPLSELMWAHYEDSNSGVCLEFDLSETPYLYEKIFEVKYDDTFPVISSMDKLPEALLTKRKVWSYEKE